MDRVSLEVKVGLVVVFAVAAAVAFLFLLGEYNPFSSTYRVTMTLSYAGGIKPGSDVHLAGAKVGKVDAIRFSRSPEDKLPVMELVLQIDKRANDLIREDSVFKVVMESLLGGKIVEISPGSIDAKVLPDGAVVKGVDPPQLEQLVAQAVDLVQEITDFIDKMSQEDKEKIKRLLSLVASFNEDDIANLKKILANLAAASEDLKTISAKLAPEMDPLLADAKGALAQMKPLLRETRVTLSDARGLLARVESTLDELTAALPQDPEERKQKIKELLAATDDLVRVAGRLDRFIARVETEFGDVSKEELERWLREFLQQEGVTINVGTIVGDPGYPPPPPKKEETKPAPASSP